MFRRAALVPLTDSDLEVKIDGFSKKRKFDSNSPSSSATSKVMEQKENTRPIDDFLTKKRTMPEKYCPKRRPPTQQVASKTVPVTTATRRPATREEDNAKLKSFLAARPHFRVERLPEVTESEDMAVLKAFRRRDYLAAQAAKATGGFKEEPKPKKKCAPKPFWKKN